MGYQTEQAIQMMGYGVWALAASGGAIAAAIVWVGLRLRNRL